MATSHAAEQVRACKARRTPPRFHASSACARWKRPRPSPCARAPASPNCEPRPRLLPRPEKQRPPRHPPLPQAGRQPEPPLRPKRPRPPSLQHPPDRPLPKPPSLLHRPLPVCRPAPNGKNASRNCPAKTASLAAWRGRGLSRAAGVGSACRPDEPAWRGRLVSVLVHFACSTAFGHERSFEDNQDVLSRTTDHVRTRTRMASN